MIFSETLLLSESGLFDFDFTFVIEGVEFILFSLVVTFSFISPISKQLDERAEFINSTLRKSTILLTFGYERLTSCVGLLTSEINELGRQVKLTKNYSNESFESEVLFVQQENGKILSKLKGDLSIKSAYLFSSITGELNSLTDAFFAKKI
mmetsp:Transcript_3854/g.3949  ORF Transcript_3854/g.3949 Transcript_3854/m.3949 type:complete len:151 (+) Transcript_3854:996-1448(+)